MENMLPAIKSNFEIEVELAKACGNTAFATSAGLRLAVSSFDAEKVREYLLNEMGMNCEVLRTIERLTIYFNKFDKFGPSKVMRALDGSFNCAYLICKNRQKAVQIITI